MADTTEVQKKDGEQKPKENVMSEGEMKLFQRVWDDLDILEGFFLLLSSFFIFMFKFYFELVLTTQTHNTNTQTHKHTNIQTYKHRIPHS